MTKNEIYLQKRLKVMLPARLVSKTKAKTVKNPLALTAMKNLDSLGYTFSRELYNELCRLSDEEIVGVYNEIVPILKKMKGAHVKHNPMYPNFPKQVVEASDLELYFNAIVHYWTLLMPSYDEENREPLLEGHKLDVIELGSDKDFNSIFTSLLSAKSSISQFDKDIVEWFVKNTVIRDLIPSEIPMKENLGLLAGKCMKYKLKADVLSSNVKTATDVLRICTAVSDGDVSLAQNCKFTKLSRSERKFILGLLDNCGNIKEDMVKYKNRWIRLGEILHPGDYSKEFTKANSAFKALRENDKIETFNSKVEASISDNNIKEATRLLVTRPGMLARRLDQLIRSTRYKYVVANEFLAVADQVATPVLLQVCQHFSARDKNQELRTIFPKGNTANAKVLKNEFDPLPTKLCESIVNGIENTLFERFGKLPKLGNVYVDPNLENYFVPFSQRSASKALKTIVRGSRIPLENDSNTVRFFIWWKNMSSEWNGRVDIDLSAMLIDENWSKSDHIAYYNLRNFGGHHSGDIVNAPNGASEFVDIDLQKCKDAGYRYVAMTIFSFTRQKFHDLPECFAGWMLRKNANSGEIFEAKTVKNKSDVTGESRMNIPLIIDTYERKVIWTDLSLKTHPNFCNNLYRNEGNTALLCKAMTELNKYNLYDLFSLHGASRGILVDDPKKADVIFSETEGITPFDVDKIISEYL